MRSRKSTVVGYLLLLGVLAVTVAGCGGAGGGGGEQGGTTQGATTQKQAATVAVADNSELGEILVDGSGRTLYLFEADEEGSSACSGACAEAWPPLTTQGEPTTGEGASADKLGTISRDNGNTQVTYNGHPLYYYAPDEQPGDAKGQDIEQFGAEWYVLSPSGDKVEEEGGGTTTSGGGSTKSGSGSSGGGY